MRSSRLATIATASAASLWLGACDLDVSNPGVVDAGTLDPVADARVLSMSAQQNFYQAYGGLINATALYSGETWTGAVRQQSNDIGRRVIVDTNIDLNGAFWEPLQTVIATNDDVVEALSGTSELASSIHVARSSMWSGFAVELMGEVFCQGVIDAGPALMPAATLDSAIVRFERAIQIAGGIGDAEAAKILDASRVGRARAHLQKGEYDAAVAVADQVSPGFVANAIYIDDPQSRGRTGNGVFGLSSLTVQIVAGDYRALDDPRIPFVDAGVMTQDGRNPLFRQAKYPSYSTPIRVASELEARYIAAEAWLEQGDPEPALALIAERRAAGEQAPFGGGAADAVLAELMDQRARDFWLEAKHLGDALRNPDATPYIAAEGDTFYKPEQGEFGPLTCLEVPFVEKANNPSF